MKQALAPVIVILCALAVNAAPAAGDAASMKKQLDRLTAIDRDLSGYHAKLADIKTEIVSIRHQAEDQNITNVAKVFIKGSLEVAGKVTAPSGLSSAYDLLTDAWNNLVTEPYLWSDPAQTKTVPVDALKRDVSVLKTNNRRLFQQCNQLIVILKSPLPRFEDDSDPFPATGDFWRKPDGKDDDETELITRKITVIRGYTGLIIRNLDAEMESARTKRKAVTAEIQSLTAALAGMKPSEDSRKTPDTSRPPRPIEYIDDRDKGDERRTDLSEAYEPSAEELKERQRRKEEQEAARRREDERRKKLEASARIIIDRDSPTRLITGEYGTYLATVEPPLETHSAIEWFVDDRPASTTQRDNASTMTTAFSQPGVHHIRAVLKIRGKEHDQHLVTVRVDAPAKPAKYPPEMEGKTTPALSLDWCTYNALYRGGKIYLTGHYYAPTGQKVSYTSLPIENFSPQAPAAGMILTKTAGYHIYQTEAEGEGARYIITRMRGTEVKILHRLMVRRFSMDVAKDYSRITIRYQTDATLNSDRWEVITLD